MLTGLPSGPSGSTIAGILLFGLSLRKAGAICSPLLMFTGITVYGSPISSSATEIFRPFGVFQVCSSMVIPVSPREALIEALTLPVARNQRALQRAFPNAVPALGRAAAGHRALLTAPDRRWNVPESADRLRPASNAWENRLVQIRLPRPPRRDHPQAFVRPRRDHAGLGPQE